MPRKRQAIAERDQLARDNALLAQKNKALMAQVALASENSLLAMQKARLAEETARLLSMSAVMGHVYPAPGMPPAPFPSYPPAGSPFHGMPSLPLDYATATQQFVLAPPALPVEPALVDSIRPVRKGAMSSSTLCQQPAQLRGGAHASGYGVQGCSYDYDCSDYSSATFEAMAHGASMSSGAHGKRSAEASSGAWQRHQAGTKGGKAKSGKRASTELELNDSYSPTVPSKTVLPPSIAKDDESQRTTVQMRNLPNNCTRDLLVDLIDNAGFNAQYNLVYMPADFKADMGLGYAFFNFTSHASAQEFRRCFVGFKDWGLDSDKVCELSWSDVLQGTQDNVERYRNSPVMHESVPDKYKPALFEDGKRVPFPEPSKTIRLPRPWRLDRVSKVQAAGELGLASDRDQASYKSDEQTADAKVSS